MCRLAERNMRNPCESDASSGFLGDYRIGLLPSISIDFTTASILSAWMRRYARILTASPFWGIFGSVPGLTIWTQFRVSGGLPPPKLWMMRNRKWICPGLIATSEMTVPVMIR